MVTCMDASSHQSSFTTMKNKNVYHHPVLLGCGLALVLSITTKYFFSPSDEILTRSQESSTQAEDTAWNYHNSALALVEEEKYEEALAFFRAAARTFPHEAHFFNNLGVTELRLDQIEKAAERFMHALELDPNFEDAKSNLETLSKYNYSAVQLPLLQKTTEDKKYQGTYRKLPRLLLSELQESHFSELNDPFILVDAMIDWKLDFFSFESLLVEFGGVDVEYYPGNLLNESQRPFYGSLRTAISQMLQPFGVFRPELDFVGAASYIHWSIHPADWEAIYSHIRLPDILYTDETWLDQCLGQPEVLKESFFLQTHWRMLLLGQKGSGMFNHQDTLMTASWQAQLNGSKEFHLCPPNQIRPMWGNPTALNTFDPDYDAFPHFENALCFQDVLEQGEIIFYPENYWHQTRCLADRTVGLTGTLVPPGGAGAAAVAARLRAECDRRTRRVFHKIDYHRYRRLCEALERRCFPLWQAAR